MLDIFSRYVVGWMVAERESGSLAAELITQACLSQNIQRHQLTVHSDRGAAMMSKPVAALLDALDVEKTVSRPHVSNDNPFIESHFKTLKYRPGFPGGFGSGQDARGRLRPFFGWYNTEHRHSGIGYMTPEVMHYGRATSVLGGRTATLRAAYRAHPERFVRGIPTPHALPTAAWINPPTTRGVAPVDQAYPSADGSTPADSHVQHITS